MVQTITAPAGAVSGGWVKLKTSKGKVRLDRVLKTSGGAGPMSGSAYTVSFKSQGEG